MKNRLPVIYFARLFFVSLLHDPWRSSDGLSGIRITAKHIQNSGRSLLNLGWHGEHAQRSHKSLEICVDFPSSPFPLKMKGTRTRSRTFTVTVCCACCASTTTHNRRLIHAAVPDEIYMLCLCQLYANFRRKASSGEKNKIVRRNYRRAGCPSPFIEAWCRRNYSLSFSLLMFERTSGRENSSCTLNTWWGGCN